MEMLSTILIVVATAVMVSTSIKHRWDEKWKMRDNVIVAIGPILLLGASLADPRYAPFCVVLVILYVLALSVATVFFQGSDPRKTDPRKRS